jgi:phenylpropionate dioxygenase-like ring-hydroxylating dioxygenase large terminal subunit
MARLMDPVLENEWYAVLGSEAVESQPVPVRILGEKVVVFRTRNGIHAFKDLCIHRGSALSLGKVEDDQLVCPYHGWKYNESGNCVCIPAQRADEKIPQRAKAVVFSCVERYGLVWVCIGEEPAPIPSFPQFDDPTFRTLTYGPYLIQATAPRIIENFLDFSHLMFVHEGILGSSNHAEIPDYRVNKVDGILTTDDIILYSQSDYDGELVPYSMHKKALTPLTAYLLKRNHSNDGVDAILINTVPLDESRTLSFTLHARNYDLAGGDTKYIILNNEIMQQDILILENQTPEELPLDLQAELNHKSDQMSIAYRRWLGELKVTIGTT